MSVIINQISEDWIPPGYMYNGTLHLFLKVII